MTPDSVPACTSHWDDTALHTSHEVVLPRGITLRVEAVRRTELVVAVNQRRLREREDITGLRLWDFGQQLAASVVRHAEAFSGRRVLEMGAGCGVLSLAIGCACIGAHVTATDASSLTFLRRNVEAHRGIFKADEVKVERLLWVTDEAWQQGEAERKWKQDTGKRKRKKDSGSSGGGGDDDDDDKGRPLSASTPDIPECVECGTMDVVIGTDLLYHLTACDVLFATAVRLLKAGGVFVLGGHSRYYGTIKSIRDTASTYALIVKFIDMRALRKAEGFEYCAGDFLAIMGAQESDVEGFVVDLNRGGSSSNTGSSFGTIGGSPPSAEGAFQFDDSVNDDFEEEEEDDY